MTKTHTSIRLAVALAALVMAFAPRTLAVTGQSALPKVAIESTRHDFGEAFAGEELMHVFTVHNTGDAPLELSKTKILARGRPASAIGLILPASFAPASAAPG